MTMRVGFIGLGSQGLPMARRIVEADYPTTVWARRSASLEPLADTPAQVAASPAELAAASDLVCVCVVGDADVEQVALAENGVLAGLGENGVLAVHSTVHPDTCRKLAVEAGKQGAQVIDAPVSGGGGAAAEGQLLVMTGGDTPTVERCRPVFESYADPVVHLGELGAGQIAKLLNNLLFTANLATAASTLTLGRELNLDPYRLGDVISRGTANSFALGRVAGTGGSLAQLAAHAGQLLNKDVGLVAALAEAAGTPGGTVLDTARATLELMDQSQ